MDISLLDLINTCGTEEEQKLAILEIISEELFQCMIEPDFIDIKKYLKNYKGSMRLSKIIPAPKIVHDSINRVIGIVESEWQSIRKMVIEEHKSKN